MSYLALHNAIMNCKKDLPQPENGMDTKQLFTQAKKIWEEQYGKPLGRLGNVAPIYDLDEFAEFETAYKNALEVVSQHCGYEASAPSANTQTPSKSKAEQIQAIIKGLEITLKRAKNEADRQKTQAIIKGLQISLKRAK